MDKSILKYDLLCTKLSRAENSKAKFRTILGKYKFLATHSDIFFFLELIFDLVG